MSFADLLGEDIPTEMGEETSDSDAVRQLPLEARQMQYLIHRCGFSSAGVPAFVRFMECFNAPEQVITFCHGIINCVAVSGSLNFDASPDDLAAVARYPLPVIFGSLRVADSKVSVMPTDWVLPMLGMKRQLVEIRKEGLSSPQGLVPYEGERLKDDAKAIQRVLDAKLGREPAILVIPRMDSVTRMFKVVFTILHERPSPGKDAIIPGGFANLVQGGTTRFTICISSWFNILRTQLLPKINAFLRDKKGSFDMAIYRAVQAYAELPKFREAIAVMDLVLNVEKFPIATKKHFLQAGDVASKELVEGLGDQHKFLLDAERKICGKGDPDTNPTKAGLPFGAKHLPNNVVMREQCKSLQLIGRIHVFGLKDEKAKFIFGPEATGEKVEGNMVPIYKVRQQTVRNIILFNCAVFSSDAVCRELMSLQGANYGKVIYLVIETINTHQHALNAAGLLGEHRYWVGRSHTAQICTTIFPDPNKFSENAYQNQFVITKRISLANINLEDRIRSALSGTDVQRNKPADVAWRWPAKERSSNIMDDINNDDLASSVFRGQVVTELDYTTEYKSGGPDPEDPMHVEATGAQPPIGPSKKRNLDPPAPPVGPVFDGNYDE